MNEQILLAQIETLKKVRLDSFESGQSTPFISNEIDILIEQLKQLQNG